MSDPTETKQSDPGLELAEMFGRGEIGAGTAARLMMVQFMRETGTMSEDELEVLENDLRERSESDEQF